MRIIKEASTSLDVNEEKFTPEGLKRAVRQAIIAELDAVNMYTKMADSIEDSKIKEIFLDITSEENVHVGEFQAVLKKLDPKELNDYEDGKKEVDL
jgi:rubrerythrin